MAYLDEFGHIGPYVGRDDPRHCTSPVFGLAGLRPPGRSSEVFATWFFKRKCELLDFEIRRSGKPAAVWEKKGSSLYTVKNVQRYPALRSFTYRMFKELQTLGGVVFYVGVEKTLPLRQHNPERLYTAVFREAIKRLDDFCVRDAQSANFLLALDQHALRPTLITQAARAMFGGQSPRRRLIEPPIHLESHRYQTVQAADWIAGLVGSLGSFWAEPESYPENEIFRRYFERRLNDISRRSGIRTR